MMSSMGLWVRNVKHLEEEPQIFNVVSVVIIVDVEPIHCVSLRVLVSNLTRVVSGWDQNRGTIGSRTFRWHQTEVVVPLHVLLLQLIKILDTVKAEFLQILLDIFCGKVRDVSNRRLTHLIRRNEVIGFSQNLVETKRKFRPRRERHNTQ